MVIIEPSKILSSEIWTVLWSTKHFSSCLTAGKEQASVQRSISALTTSKPLLKAIWGCVFTPLGLSELHPFQKSEKGEEIIQTFLFCGGHAPPHAKVVYFWGGCIFSGWLLRCNLVRSHFRNTLCLQRPRIEWCAAPWLIYLRCLRQQNMPRHINIPLLPGKKIPTCYRCNICAGNKLCSSQGLKKNKTWEWRVPFKSMCKEHLDSVSCKWLFG